MRPKIDGSVVSIAPLKSEAVKKAQPGDFASDRKNVSWGRNKSRCTASNCEFFGRPKYTKFRNRVFFTASVSRMRQPAGSKTALSLAHT